MDKGEKGNALRRYTRGFPFAFAAVALSSVSTHTLSLSFSLALPFSLSLVSTLWSCVNFVANLMRLAELVRKGFECQVATTTTSRT